MRGTRFIPSGKKLISATLFFLFAYSTSVVIFAVVATLLSVVQVSVLWTISVALLVACLFLFGMYIHRLGQRATESRPVVEKVLQVRDTSFEELEQWFTGLSIGAKLRLVTIAALVVWLACISIPSISLMKQIAAYAGIEIFVPTPKPSPTTGGPTATRFIRFPVTATETPQEQRLPLPTGTPSLTIPIPAVASPTTQP